jgi:hypothetical protein
MTRFSEFLDHRQPEETLVRQYVATRGEWVALEFKTADRAPQFGLRKTVSAFGNKDGGDIFLGVTDDGSVDGTTIDLATVSRVLEQEGAPPRDRTITDLVPLVHEPRRIALSNGKFVYWIDVAAQGLLVAAFDPTDGLLHLYDRPGAESEELKGFAAIDLFQRKTRARLLVSIFSEFRRIVKSIPQYYTVPNQVRQDTIRPILLILESTEWQSVATEADRSLTNNAYMGGLLSFPEDAEQWEHLPYQKKDGEWRMRTLTMLPYGVQAFEAYLVAQRIVVPT